MASSRVRGAIEHQVVLFDIACLSRPRSYRSLGPGTILSLGGMLIVIKSSRPVQLLWTVTAAW